MVAKMEVKEPIEGICNNEEVYAIIPGLSNQKEAKCPVSKDAILVRLHFRVDYIKKNPKHKDKGMIAVIINCKGEVVRCKMDQKTKSEELDKQIEKVFSELGDWEAAQVGGEDVDSVLLYSFKIKKGIFRWD